MHTVPAGIAAACVVLGVAYAVRGLRSTAAKAAAGGAVLLILLLPSHALAFFFLQGPWHIGTAGYALIAFGLVARPAGRWRLLRAVAAAVLLGAGTIGDLQELFFGAIPIAVVGLLEMARRRDLRQGWDLVATGVGAAVAAVVIRVLAVQVGAFAITAGHHVAKASVVRQNGGRAVAWSSAILGVRTGPYGGPARSLPVDLAHLAGVAVIVVGVLGGLWSLARGVAVGRNPDRAIARLDDMLLVAAAADLVVFAALTLSANTLYARYLTAGLLFAIVLGGRMLGRATDAGAARGLATGWRRAAAAVVAVVVLAGYVTDVAAEVRAPNPVAPTSGLGAFLLAHGLHEGLAEYWAASILTVRSGGALEVRPAVATAKGLIERDARQTTSAWYDRQRFQFLVWEQTPYGRITLKSATRTYGPPERTWRIDRYTVAVWGHPIGISRRAIP